MTNETSIALPSISTIINNNDEASDKYKFILLSHKDSDILTCSSAKNMLPLDFPPVDTVDLTSLKNDSDMRDVLNEKLLNIITSSTTASADEAEEASLSLSTTTNIRVVIIVRLLGRGVPGFHHVLNYVKHNPHHSHLIVVSGVPGSYEPDLTAMCSNVSHETINEVMKYFHADGCAINMSNMLRYLGDHLFKFGYGYDVAVSQPDHGLYHPRFSALASARNEDGSVVGREEALDEYLHTCAMAADNKPVVAIIFYRCHYLSGNTAFVDALLDELEALDVHAIGLFTETLRAHEPHANVNENGPVDKFPTALTHVLNKTSGKCLVDVLISSMAFAMGEVNPDGPTLGNWSADALRALNVPVLQAINSVGTYDEWKESARGLNPLDTAMNVVIPEFDGRIITVPISFMAPVEDNGEDVAGTSSRKNNAQYYEPVVDRVEAVAKQAARLGRLRHKPNSEKRVAFLLTNSSGKAERIGDAVGLDTPASIIKVFDAMRDAGYHFGNEGDNNEALPKDGDTLIANLIDRCSYDEIYLTEHQLAHAAGRVPSEVYKSMFNNRLPKKQRDHMIEQWGEPPGEAYVHNDAIALAGLEFGNVFMALQPPRGYGMDPDKIYHTPDLPPPHNYYALYGWLRDEWKADAIVHMGKHGTLEWLPGKGVGLSSECYPDTFLDDLPLIYPFIINDPGEGMQSKRRAHAVIIDHLTPPITTADGYGELAQLMQLVDEYYQIEMLDPTKLPLIQKQIMALIETINLDEDLSFILNHDHEHSHGEEAHGHDHHDHSEEAADGHDHSHSEDATAEAHGHDHHHHIEEAANGHDHGHSHSEDETAEGNGHDHHHHSEEAADGHDHHHHENLDYNVEVASEVQVHDHHSKEDTGTSDCSHSHEHNHSHHGEDTEDGAANDGQSNHHHRDSSEHSHGHTSHSQHQSNPDNTQTHHTEDCDHHSHDSSTHDQHDEVPNQIGSLLAKMDGKDFAHLIEDMEGYLCELAQAQIRDGLHILGKYPVGDTMIDMLQALTRLDNLDVPSLRGAVAAMFDLDTRELLENQGARVQDIPPMLVQLADRPLVSAGDVIETIDELVKHLLSLLEQKHFAWKEIHAAIAETFPGLERSIIEDSDVYVALYFVCRTIVPSLHDTTQEITNLINALNGEFVPAGPSGSPTRGMAHLLPTGRNFYACDPQALPSLAAWEVGQGLAKEVMARYLSETGTYPEHVAISVWGTAAMRTHGDDIAQIFSLLGIRPIWHQENHRVTGVELIPLSELGRPRIDVTVRISGFFRDAFPHLITLLDDSVNLAINADEPPDQNYIRKHYLEDMEKQQSEESARYRIFGCPPGAYGIGILDLIEAQNWKDESDFAKCYINWGGYAYSKSSPEGIDARTEFTHRLSTVEVAIHNQDDREHDIFDSDDYFQFHGGMIATIKALSGKKPKGYFGDTQNPAAPKVRDVKEETLRVYRTRVVNPKWLESIQQHGYKGASEMAATVDYMFGFDATADVVSDFMYEKVAQNYALDKGTQEFFEKSNPWALRGISERLLEAAQRGMWAEPDPDTIEALKQTLLKSDTTLEGRSEPN